MLNSTEQLAADEIVDWLHEAPTKEEILYYVRHFPADKEYLLAEAIRQYAEKLYEDKYSFFKKNNCDYFVEKIAEVDQFVFLDWLSDYSAASVIPNIQKQYPGFIGEFPPTIPFWSKNFLERWLSLTFLATATEFENCSVYARSFLSGSFTDAQLQEIDQHLRNIILESGKRYDAREIKDVAQVEQERGVLKTLGFFPDEYIDKLTKNTLGDEEITTLFRIVKVISVILAFTLEKARADIEAFFDSFRELLRSEYEERSLVQFDSWRIVETQEIPELIPVSNAVTSFFTLENIRAQAVRPMLNDYYGRASDAEKQFFRGYIYTFLRESTLLDFIVDPLTVDFLLTCLENIRDDNTFRTFVVAMEEQRQSPAQPETFAEVLNILWYVTTSFPQNEVKVQASAQPTTYINQPA